MQLRAGVFVGGVDDRADVAEAVDVAAGVVAVVDVAESFTVGDDFACARLDDDFRDWSVPVVVHNACGDGALELVYGADDAFLFDDLLRLDGHGFFAEILDGDDQSLRLFFVFDLQMEEEDVEAGVDCVELWHFDLCANVERNRRACCAAIVEYVTCGVENPVSFEGFGEVGDDAVVDLSVG